MKFFKVTLISSFLFLNWAYHDDVQDTPEPSHRLYSLYSKLYDNSDCLLYENFCDKYPYSKSKTFIETKVTAMKLQGFNL